MQPSPEIGPQQDLVIGPEYSNPDMQPMAAGPTFSLTAVQVDPSAFLSRGEIDGVVQPDVGRDANFADLSAIVGKLNALYQTKGQITARAVAAAKDRGGRRPYSAGRGEDRRPRGR